MCVYVNMCACIHTYELKVVHKEVTCVYISLHLSKSTCSSKNVSEVELFLCLQDERGYSLGEKSLVATVLSHKDL